MRRYAGVSNRGGTPTFGKRAMYYIAQLATNGRSLKPPYNRCKSIKQDVLEGDFAVLLKALVPSRGMFKAAQRMFEIEWT